MELTFNALRIPEKDLITIRKSLYHSQGPGYFVIKNFISKEMVNHMVDFWSNEDFSKATHVKVTSIDKSKMFYLGCPNYFYKYPVGHAFYNYFWNLPADEATMAVSFTIQQLRNTLQSYNNYHEFFPFSGNSCSFRVVFSMNGKDIVAPHTDWLTPQEMFKPERLQATLILTKKGVDYSGKGMWMMGNDKKSKFVFDEQIEVNPGDLVFWRYNNLHGVEDVSTSPGQKGFIRMIFPPEFISIKGKESWIEEFSGKELMAELKKRTKRKFLK